MTQLSVKTLRHYHDVGLVEPHHVDSMTGYRYYSRDQVPTDLCWPIFRSDFGGVA
jgi:DNA-binding transcriptional MerR regulator